MTDKVFPSFGNVPRSRGATAAIAFGGGAGTGVIWEAADGTTERLIEDPEGDLATGALNRFGESHSATSLDVTIDTGEALVRGAYLARDVTTTVTLAASTNGQAIEVGWKDGQPDTILIGERGTSVGDPFTSTDPSAPLFTFDTDGSGVTSVTDDRRLRSEFRIRQRAIEQGAGSGLDADTVDGSHKSDIVSAGMKGTIIGGYR